MIGRSSSVDSVPAELWARERSSREMAGLVMKSRESPLLLLGIPTDELSESDPADTVRLEENLVLGEAVPLIV
jgi:hypothetical protein